MGRNLQKLELDPSVLNVCREKKKYPGYSWKLSSLVEFQEWRPGVFHLERLERDGILGLVTNDSGLIRIKFAYPSGYSN